MPLTLLPKHSPALRPGDYLAYAAPAPLRSKVSLEAAWAPLLPGRRLIGTPAGRHALWYFLEAAEIPPGSDVLVAAYNYYVVVSLLVQWGLRPVFVDIDPDTLTIDPADLARKATPESRLVLVTHMFGNPADMRAIRAICRERGLRLFEDCAHAVGTRDERGRQVGGASDGALFSFGPHKLLTSFGGGMLAIDPALAAGYRPPRHPTMTFAVRSAIFMKMLLTLGMTRAAFRWTLHPLTEVARRLAARGWTWLRDLAAPARQGSAFRFDLASRAPFKPFMPVLCARQLRRLEANVARRRAVVAAVKRAVGRQRWARFLDEDKFGLANGAYFGVYVGDAQAFAAFMLARGVEAAPNEFCDCASLPQFADFAAACPNAGRADRELVRLPSYPTLSDRDVRRIGAAMVAYGRSLADPPLPAEAARC